MAFDHLKQQVIDIEEERRAWQEQGCDIERRRERIYAYALDNGMVARDIAEMIGKSRSLVSTIAKKGRAQR